MGHRLTVHGADGCEFVAAVFELQAKVGALLFEAGDFLVERVDVGGCAELGFAHALFAERIRQALFEVPDAGGELDGAFVGGEQVGLQGCAGDGGSCGFAASRRGGFGCVDLLEQVTVLVEEGPVDAGGAGDARALISAPLMAAQSSVVRTRCLRLAESA